MSILDKVVAAVTPPESEGARREARVKARAAAGVDDWLAQIIGHHEEIEGAFALVKAADDTRTRLAAQRELAILLNAHANAEEAVIYPALTRSGHKFHATSSYAEQAGAKANLGELEYLDPLSEEFEDKLEHIRDAVAHHVYEEESDRFLDLKQLSDSEQLRLTRRYAEEFNRFMGHDARAKAPPSTANARSKPAP